MEECHSYAIGAIRLGNFIRNAHWFSRLLHHPKKQQKEGKGCHISFSSESSRKYSLDKERCCESGAFLECPPPSFPTDDQIKGCSCGKSIIGYSFYPLLYIFFFSFKFCTAFSLCICIFTVLYPYHTLLPGSPSSGYLHYSTHHPEPGSFSLSF